ncbi:hypothetical protein DFH28DRAFT_926540 [Melampsora americana]|nr:hypothetical protein DFH28DRAFT_926540 [Melampsora americana]
MVRYTEPNVTKYPLSMHFIGHIGRNDYNENNKERGMPNSFGTIVTSFQNNHVKETPILLVALDSAGIGVFTGDICCISGKLIASNTTKLDYLYFTAATKIKIGEKKTMPTNFMDEITNKVALIGLGIILRKSVIEYDIDGFVTKVELILQSVDFDPMVFPIHLHICYNCTEYSYLHQNSNVPVVWTTRHIAHPSLFPLGVENQFNEGEEVHISAMVVDYDESQNMWLTHVYDLASGNPKLHQPMDAEDNHNVTKQKSICVAEITTVNQDAKPKHRKLSTNSSARYFKNIQLKKKWYSAKQVRSIKKTYLRRRR